MSIRQIDTRLQELLVDQVTGDMEADEFTELETLLEQDAVRLQDDYMETAALIQLGLLEIDRRERAPMPDELRERILAAAPSKQELDNIVAIEQTRPAAKPPRRRLPVQTWSGWAVAATLAVVLLAGNLLNRDPAATDYVARRDALLATAPDVLSVPWSPPETAEFAGVTGEVVWSDDRQEGYMILAGMPVNNPASEQFQLWIVDPDRAEQPVDGGVFNIAAADGELIIPIDSALPISQPAAFAITREKPGGVVVSAGPLLVVAPVG